MNQLSAGPHPDGKHRSRARRIAVIGSGVSGLVAAHVCSAQADVTLIEADDRLGGHADTHDVVDGDRTLGIDTGFIVHNRVTYPTLIRIFDELGVPTQPSEMSMSIADEPTEVEWAGARGVRGLIPGPRRLVDPRHLRMLAEIPRFHRAARELLDRERDLPTGGNDLTTLADFLAGHRFSDRLRTHFLEPLVAAVWSCDPEVAGEYPALYLFEFLAHHGMLSVTGSPEWRTVTGGSRTYVDAIAAHLRENGGRILTGARVESVLEEDDGVRVVARRADGSELRETFDAVLIATHPHQTLAMLAAPTPLQKEVLGAITYSRNPAVLHTDQRLMPRARATWGSWNFRRRATSTGQVTVTYDLTRLQRLDTETPYLVTLGGSDLIDPSTVIAEMDYEHPLYTPESVAAQRRLPEIESERIVFAGAYHGWGFHEDGARSGAAAASRLGFTWPQRPAAVRPSEKSEERVAAPVAAEPTVYATRITHRRQQPWRRAFSHRSLFWVVDLDAASTPPTGPLGRVRSWFTGTLEARDHLGDPTRSVRENVATFLAGEGIELGAGTVRVATHPRSWGFCFNPISVFWCRDQDGSPLATIVEVHNTYGDRHAYLLTPHGSTTLAKAMYVSPFHGVDGTYRVTAPEPETDGPLAVTVDLRTEVGSRFTASMIGGPVTGHRLRAGLVGPRDALLIRIHGIVLWLRRLPLQPRPIHHQEGVS